MSQLIFKVKLRLLLSSKNFQIFLVTKPPRITSTSCVVILFQFSISLQNHTRTRHDGLNVTFKRSLELASNETGVGMSLKNITLSNYRHQAPRASGCYPVTTTAGKWRNVFAWMPAAALVATAVCREICAHWSYKRCCTASVNCIAVTIW